MNHVIVKKQNFFFFFLYSNCKAFSEEDDKSQMYWKMPPLFTKGVSGQG